MTEDAPAVEVADRQDRVRLPAERVRALVEHVWRAEGAEPVPLLVALVDDAEIRRVHREHMDDDTPTDVITFDYGPDEPPSPGPDAGPRVEIVVSTETAVREAAARGGAAEREALFYVVHGVLHSLGWDDHDPAERERMLARQDELLGDFEATA